MRNLRKFVNNLLAKTGYQIRALHVPLQSFDSGMEALSRILSVDVVVDIGVANGTPGLYKAFPGRSVLLVEANPHYEKGVRQIAQQLNAKFEMVFCGATRGEVELWDAGESSSSYKFNEHLQKVRVPMETLDILIERNNMSGNSLIKIDVEGAEMEVLKGASRTLAGAKAVVMEICWGRERDGNHYADEIAFMRQHGFTLFNILEGGGILEHNRLVHADFVFVRREQLLTSAS